MRRINALAIGIVIFSIALGTSLGLLVQSDQPPNQIFYFTSFAVHTSSPMQCSTIPGSYSNWLGIDVVGNRTGMSFQTVDVFAAGRNIRISLPLSDTAFTEFKSSNSTFETILVPLPNYFNAGDVLTVSLTYSITSYPPTSQTLPETPITLGSIDC